MIIECPSCAAKFTVPDGAIPQAGRTVKCAKCQNTWHFTPPSDDTAADNVEDSVTESSVAPAEGEESVDEKMAQIRDILNQTPQSDEPDDLDDGDEPEAPTQAATDDAATEEPAFSAPPPAVRKESGERMTGGLKYNLPTPGWLGFVAFVCLLIGFGGLAKADIVEMWEPAAKFYDIINLPVPVVGEGLAFVEVEAKEVVSGNKSELSVTGKIKNTTDTVLDIPLIQAELVVDGAPAMWTFVSSLPRLLPGESTTFKTQYPDKFHADSHLAIRFTKLD